MPSLEARTRLSLVSLTLAYIINALLADLGRGVADLSMLLLFVVSVALMSSRMRLIPLLPLLASAIGFSFEYIGLNFALPFGSYSYLRLRGFALQGVPVPVIVAWGVYAYTCYLAASHLTSGRMKLLSASLLMVLLDLALDPVMVERGLWKWNAGGEWFGVPLTNYAGWFLVSILSMALYALISGGRDLNVRLPHQAYIPYLSSYLVILMSSGPASTLPAYLAFSLALLPLLR
ncbi:MAG: carotenoid biosynthesis protein [Candidatus Korarchaeota archaeon NZ13-K]|nr:MAG: carotenoid biosynthesis protein [Candidatus Korarchaeota archaeon NZ13-K]